MQTTTATRRAAARTAGKPEYVGADEQVIASSMTAPSSTPGGQAPGAGFQRLLPPPRHLSYYSDAIWYPDPDAALGQIPEARPDAWFEQVAKGRHQPASIARPPRPSSPRAAQASDFPDFASEQGYRGPRDGFHRRPHL